MGEQWDKMCGHCRRWPEKYLDLTRPCPLSGQPWVLKLIRDGTREWPLTHMTVGFKSCSVNFTALEEPADGVVISSYEEMVRKYVVSVTLFPLVKAIK